MANLSGERSAVSPLLFANHCSCRPAGSLPAGLHRRAARPTRQPGRDARLHGQALVGAGSCPDRRAKGIAWTGCSMSALVPPSRLGAMIICGPRPRGEAIARTSSAVRLGISVGRIRNFGCAACHGVAGSLGQGRVELRFGLGFNPAARRWRRIIRCRSAADGGRRRAWLTLFGQHMAARPFSHGQRVPVAADDNDLRVNVRQVDGRQRTRKQFAVEGVPFLGRDMASQTALALTEGLDGNDRPQARPGTRVIRHFRAGRIRSAVAALQALGEVQNLRSQASFGRQGRS